MSTKCIVPVTALILAVLGVNFMTVQGKTTKAPDREADKQAIDKLIKEQIQSFNIRDAAAVTANWTTDAEYIRNDGEPVRGRAEIQKGYAEFFKTLKGKPTAAVQVDNLRFPAADMAVSEVTLRLKNEEGELIGSSWRNTVLAREDGHWKVALVQEWDRDNALDDGLKDLEWLIGSWRMDSQDREMTTTYEWDENKKFIRGKFSDKHGGQVVESGTQMIGQDKANGGIRSWVFQSQGGFGDGLWTRDGKKWTIDFEGATPDGKKLTASVIYNRVDGDTFTWQSVQQTVDGEPIPDSRPIRVTRQKASR
jgi:uncharacterized protein (TIGR02246 family)